MPLERSIFDSSGWMLWAEDRAAGQRQWIKRDAENPRKWHVRTDSWQPSLIAEANERDRNNRAGQRFGDGYVHVGRIPVRDLFRDKGLGGAFKDQDQGYIREYLNRNPHLKSTDKTV